MSVYLYHCSYTFLPYPTLFTIGFSLSSPTIFLTLFLFQTHPKSRSQTHQTYIQNPYESSNPNCKDEEEEEEEQQRRSNEEEEEEEEAASTTTECV